MLFVVFFLLIGQINLKILFSITYNCCYYSIPQQIYKMYLQVL